MLVLTRKYQEKIRIGHNITVTVFRIKGNTVRLGIEAPDSVTVLRGELAFDHETESAIEPEADSFGAIGLKQHTRPGSASIAKCWARDDGNDRIEGVSACEVEPEVKVTRMQRNKLVGMLTKLISGNEPLPGTSF